MRLQGAHLGGVKLISEPLLVFRASTDKGEDVEQLQGRLRWVPPRIESLCRAIAEFYLRQMLSRIPTDEMVAEEQQLLMVSWSLRVDDGVYAEQVFPFPAVLAQDQVSLLPKDEQLFMAVRDCAVHMRCPQGPDLWADYQTFRRTEFPTVASDKQLDQLLEDAQKKSLMTLLSEHGFWKVVRLARGLDAARRGLGAGSGTAG